MPLPLEEETTDALLQSVFDTLGQGVALFRQDGMGDDLTFIRVNPCFAGLFGEEPEALCGKVLCEWDLESDLRLGELFNRVRLKGKKREEKIGIGGDRWFQLTGLPLPEGVFCLFVTETTETVRTHRKLSRSSELFKTLVEESGAFFCEYGPGGILSYVNGTYCDFAGVREEEVLGNDFYRYIPPDQREEVRAGIEALSPQAPFHSSEHAVLRADGSLTWQRWMDRVFFNEDGSVSTYCSVGFDITAQREAEESRKGQAVYFEALFNSSPIATCFSRNYQICQVNPAFCDLFRLTPEDVLGSDAREIISPPGQIQSDCEDIVQQMDRGEAVMRDTVRYRSDGELIHVRIIGVPYQMVQGNRGYFAFFQDLAETVELETESMRNRIVVEESPVVIFEAPLGFGSHCRFISENVSQFGYRADEVMSGQISLDMKTHPEDLRRLAREVAEANRTGRAYREYTFRLLTAEGKYRWVNERNRVLFGPGGEPQSLIGVLIDQTELVQVQQELRKGNERLSRHAREMEEAWEQTILLLAGVTEMRDPYTRGHQFRVAHLCGAIGEELNFQEEPLRELVQAAHIHDIGKMEIPSDYLNRPGKLLPEEFEFIKEHPGKGHELLSGIKVAGFLPEIVYQHHERLDGSGYPRGLKGEEILLSARVLAVADVVEAMLSHRPYRPAFPLDDVMEEISRGMDILYDRQVVTACICLFREKKYAFPPVAVAPQ